MQNIKEISDTLRGPKVNARRHWDGENWILEDAKTRKPLLIGTRAQILDEYDRISDTPTRVLANGRGFLRHGRTPQRTITSPLHPVTGLPLSRLFCGCLF